MVSQQELNKHVGRTDPETVVQELQAQLPNMDIHSVSTDSMVTADFRTDRIRVWYEFGTNKITELVVG